MRKKQPRFCRGTRPGRCAAAATSISIVATERHYLKRLWARHPAKVSSSTGMSVRT